MNSNPGVRYGLIGGIVVVCYFLLLYAAKPDYFLSPLLQWGSLGFYLLFMWQAARKDAAVKGTNRDFRDLIRTPFIVFLIINLCYWLFFYALHLYDKGLVVQEISIAINSVQAQLDGGAGDPEQANKLRSLLVDLEKDLKFPPQLGIVETFTDMMRGALGGFVLAAGIAAIVRSK